jgi:hypothetical protein
VAGSWSNAAQSLIVLIEEVTGYSGIFGYSPAPGTGTLVFSLAAAAGTDPYGNAYPQGLSIGSDTTRQIVLNYNGTAAAIDFSVNNGHGHSSGGLIEQIFNPAAVNEFLSFQAIGPGIVGHTDVVSLQLNSQNLDGSSNANAQIRHTTGGALQTWDNTQSVLTVPLTVSGNETVTGNLVAGSMDSGSFSITPTVAGQWTANTAVTFNKTFSSTPVVMVTPSGNGPGVGTTTKLEWQTTGASTTGFNCRILRDNTTATTLSWFAVLT